MPLTKIWYTFHSSLGNVKNVDFDIIVNLLAQPDAYIAHMHDTTQYLVGTPNIPLIGANSFLMVLQVKIRAKNDGTESNLYQIPTVVTYGEYRNNIISGAGNSIDIYITSDSVVNGLRTIVINSGIPFIPVP